MKLENSESIVFNILSFYEVMYCVLSESVVYVCAGLVGPFEDTYGLHDDGTPRSAETCRIGICASKVFISQCTKSWLDRSNFAACAVHTQY